MLDFEKQDDLATKLESESQNQSGVEIKGKVITTSYHEQSNPFARAAQNKWPARGVEIQGNNPNSDQ